MQEFGGFCREAADLNQAAVGLAPDSIEDLIENYGTANGELSVEVLEMLVREVTNDGKARLSVVSKPKAADETKLIVHSQTRGHWWSLVKAYNVWWDADSLRRNGPARVRSPLDGVPADAVFYTIKSTVGPPAQHPDAGATPWYNGGDGDESAPPILSPPASRKRTPTPRRPKRSRSRPTRKTPPPPTAQQWPSKNPSPRRWRPAGRHRGDGFMQEFGGFCRHVPFEVFSLLSHWRCSWF